MTRLMALFDNFDGMKQIGNSRSARPYYIYFAKEYDAVFAHFGQSVHAKEILDTGIVDELNGLGAESSKVFYRTSEHAAPHNAYTSTDGILAGIEFKGIDMNRKDSTEDHFRFALEAENTLENGGDCKVIQPYFMTDSSYFIYDDATKEYAHYQFGGKHLDHADGDNQVTCSNIIFENINSSLYAGTAYLNIPLTGSGQGKFFTRGKMTDITWKKDSNTSVTRYYYDNGEEIELNPGRTWVCLVENQHLDKNRFYATVEEFK